MRGKKENWKRGAKTLLFVMVIFAFVLSCCRIVAAAGTEEGVPNKAETQGEEMQGENMQDETSVRKPGYDAAYLSALLEGVGFADGNPQESADSANNVNSADSTKLRMASAGGRVSTSVLAADQGTIDMVRYSEDGQSWDMVDSWSEGVLGADGEWAFCADPTTGFQSGDKTVYNAASYYNQYTIDTIGCAFAWYDQWKTTLGFTFTSSQDYFFKQILVWEVLNEVHGWYPGITLEFGNNVLCPDGVHYVSEYTWQVLQYGIENATNPAWRAKWECSGVILKGNGQDLCQWEYHPAGGYVEMKKSASDTGFTEGNTCYSLKGAQYGIYQGEQQKAVLTTDENGYARSEKLDVGEYTIREIQAPPGYQIDVTPYQVTVQSSQTSTVEVTDNPVSAAAELKLKKLDAGSKSSTPQGAASLSGAQFTVRFYEGYYTADTLPEEADCTWVFETKEETDEETGDLYAGWKLSEEYKVSGDDFYRAQDGTCILPLGTLTVEESKAPEGYLLQGAVFRQVSDTSGQQENIWNETCLLAIKQDGDRAYIEGGNVCEAADAVVRGDFSFTKIEEESQRAMADIPFRITSKTTGENHVIVTDENGYYSSSSEYIRHSLDTNMEKAGAGLWFGLDSEGQTVPVDDGLGALPYDTYTIEELPCVQNEGKVLYQGEFTITRNHFVLDMGTIENADMPKTPGEKETPEKETQKETAKEGQKTVQTGDEAVVGMYAAGILASLGVLLLAVTERRFWRKGGKRR